METIGFPHLFLYLLYKVSTTEGIHQKKIMTTKISNFQGL